MDQADLARMIEGGRRKWNIPNPTHDVDDRPPPPSIDLLQWTADRYAGEARPITWLCRGTIPLGLPALIAAMGGLGKSYLALDLALQIAAGVAGLEQPRKILGGRIAVEGTAVVVTADRGIIKLPKGAPDFAEAKAAYCSAKWIGPGRGWVDPHKEATAATERLAAGLSTLERECAEQGEDYLETIQQRARERKEMLALGLDPDAVPDRKPPSDDDDDPTLARRSKAFA